MISTSPWGSRKFERTLRTITNNNITDVKTVIANNTVIAKSLINQSQKKP